MLVQSHGSFWMVGDFDPLTAEFTESRRKSAEEPPLAQTGGAYLSGKGERAVFYRHDGSLWLCIGSTSRNLDQPGVEARYERVGGDSRLELLDRGVPIAAVTYQPAGEGGAEDLTPFVESEDWDFGLFVHNVLVDAGRRARIYGGAPSS